MIHVPTRLTNTAAHQELMESLADELLTQVREASPAFLNNWWPI